MKRVISLLLCFMMVFCMMPAVIAAPVMDSVESADYETTEVLPDETVEEVNLAANEVYATKPAQYDADRGILVFFENGNPDDDYNITNATLVGHSDANSAIDGYFTRDIKNPTAAGIDGTYAIGLDTGDTDTHFAYANGTDFKGSIRFYADIYNNYSPAIDPTDYDFNLSFYPVRRPQTTSTSTWDSWNGVSGAYTDWTGKTAYSVLWTELGVAVEADLSFVGLARKSTWGVEYAFVRSAYAYYDPTNKVTLYVNDALSEIIDLGDATEWTAVAPSDPTLEWIDEHGNSYNEGDKVPAGTVLTTISGSVSYAAKPAQYDAYRGILVFFENGNPEDDYNITNATLVGYSDANYVKDGYFARDIENPTAAKIDGTWGIGLDTGDTNIDFAYADGTDFKGSIRFYADMHNSYTEEELGFYWAVRTEWDPWCGVGTNWKAVWADPNAWTELEIATHTDLSFVGLGRLSKSYESYLKFRSAYAYYDPRNKVTLYVNDALSEIIDLGTETEWTVVAPADKNLVWVDENGIFYGEGDTVSAGTVLNTMEIETAPYSIQKTSIRTTDPNGIRFAGFVTNAMKNIVDEYGFVIARQDVISNVEDVVFGAANTVNGIAYNKSEGTDIVYIDASESTDEATEQFGAAALDMNGYYFTGVLKGVPMTSDALQEKLIARTYYKIGDTYYYGDAIIDSIYDTAVRLMDNYPVLPAYMQQIIDIVETPAQ